MDQTVTVALISAGGPTLVGLAALILSYRGFASIDSRFSALENRITGLDNRMTSLESTMSTRFDLILGV